MARATRLVLVVESLDRLSRAEPIIARNLLTRIVMAGITVVAPTDGIEYTCERIKANPGILFAALGAMMHGREASKIKSGCTSHR